MGSHYRVMLLVRFSTQNFLSKLENGIQCVCGLPPFCYLLNRVMSLVKYKEIMF